MSLTRRQFVSRTTAAAAATAAAAHPLSASVARALSSAPGVAAEDTHKRLSEGWELFQGPLAGPWEVWHSEELAVFSPVTLPHSVNANDACDPDTPYYRGQAWYRTRLKVANPFNGGRTLLHFLGAGQNTTVWVGAQQVGAHEGGYDEWVVDITDAVAGLKQEAKDAGKGVPLSVLCDNSRRLDTVPSDFSDFSLYGGIYRPVELVYVPAWHIERVQVDTARTESEQPQVTVIAFLLGSNAPSGGRVPQPSLEVRDPSGNVVAVKAPLGGDLGAATWTFSLPNAQRWSPAAPHLYTCTVTLRSGGDTQTLTERFGIRHYEFVEHGPFKLNGERLLLRGTHRHEDHAGLANALPDDLIRKEMQLIKDMGANFIRLGHYQQHRLVLEICDELGILVWEEIPWCRGGVGGEHFKNMVHEKLRNMIAQHRNHPSVILWGLGNEDDWPTEYPSIDKPAIRAFMTELRDIAHQLDPSRLTSFRRCDFARDIPDVYSPSIWAGWYSGLYTEYQASLEKQVKLQPRMLHIEWGADSHAGRHSEAPDKAIAAVGTGHGTDERGLDYKPSGGPPRVSRDGDWSETYACNLFDWHLKVQESLPWLTGAAQWIFKDFTTPLRAENPVPRINQKGVTTRDLQLKESYFVFQSYWAEKPMVHIYGSTWPVRWGDAGEQKVIKVYSNCEEVELFYAALPQEKDLARIGELGMPALKGKSLGKKRRNAQDFPAAGLRWMVPLAGGEHLLRAVGTRGGQSVEHTIRFHYETRKWGAPAGFQLSKQVVAGKEAAAARRTEVQAQLRDAATVPCLDARQVVRWSLAGPGRLIDNQGTPWGSRVVQLANGRARITAETHGPCTIAIAAEGVPTAFLQI